MDKETLVKVLKLSHVPRWTIIDMMKPQSVADHSFRVAAICKYIISMIREFGTEVEENQENEIIVKAMFHDLDEAVTGDIPSTAKADDVYTQARSKAETASFSECILKIADNLEASIFVERYGVCNSRFRNSKITTEIRSKTIPYMDRLMSLLCADGEGISRGAAAVRYKIMEGIVEIGTKYE